jgi:hypothetical protein
MEATTAPTAEQRWTEGIMRVLVACEESQAVTKEFRKLGHEAYSCDLQECSGGHPEWHICGSVIPLINGKTTFCTADGTEHRILTKWDMIIAHPPCTFLTNGGAVQMFRNEKKDFPPYGTFQMVNVDRLKEGMLARDFFMLFMFADCERVAIENPIPMTIYMLDKPTQIIQPYMFGDPYSKKTCLWLKGLPPLQPTNELSEWQPFINGGGGRLEKPNYKGKKFANGSCGRSKTFPGVAKAMAEQWGGGENG